MDEELIVDWEECEYCHRSYYEYDTGYSEYECELTGFNCMGDEYCPLSCKYNVVEE